MMENAPLVGSGASASFLLGQKITGDLITEYSPKRRIPRMTLSRTANCFGIHPPSPLAAVFKEECNRKRTVAS